MSVHTPTPVDSRPSRAIVLGGARSGKSTFAESQLAQCEVVTYVATSARNPDDPEWTERIRLHQQRRPESWRTAETLDVAAVLLDDDPSPVLVDCLGVWITRILDEVAPSYQKNGFVRRREGAETPLVVPQRRTRSRW